MFDREEHIEKMKRVMPAWSNEQLEKDADFMEKKFSRIKKGNNTIHIKYIGGLLSEDNLIDIDKELSKINYELSSLDESGIAKASNFVSEVILYLNDYTVQQTLLSGVVTSAIWDTIKIIATYTWKEIRKNTYFKISGNKTITENRASFSIKTKDFEFNTENLTDETFEKSLDKILDYLREGSNKEKSHAPIRPKIAIYNQNTEEWKIVDLTPEMMRSLNDKIIRTMSIEEFENRRNIS